MTIDYSVIIRTIGKAGEKYQNLLNSIAALEPQPREVIVVLPEGYDVPAEKLGWETFYYSPKGMVAQRMYGVAQCKTPYALICDDDVSFGSDFVQMLYEPIKMGLARLSSGPLYPFLPKKGIRAIVDTVRGAAAPTLIHKDRYVSVLRSSGYSYNRHLDTRATTYYESQSLPWTCFFADIHALDMLDFEAETWIDGSGYAAMDDQTMFYKAWLRGLKTVVVSTAIYEHLDGRTSTKGNRDPVFYASTYNRLVFWHRFIYQLQPNTLMKLYATLCFGYYIVMFFAFDIISLMRGKLTTRELAIHRKGLVDALSYIQSDEYKNLPPVL